MHAGPLWEADPLGDGSDLVWRQPNGRPVRPEMDWRDWRNLQQRAGVRVLRVHDARLTAATILLEQGVAPRVAMEILGHSSIQLTANTCQHALDGLRRDAADRAGDALFGGPGAGCLGG